MASTCSCQPRPTAPEFFDHLVERKGSVPWSGRRRPSRRSPEPVRAIAPAEGGHPPASRADALLLIGFPAIDGLDEWTVREERRCDAKNGS